MIGGSSSSRDAIRRDIRKILGPGGAAAEMLPGYEARAGQLAMAERIADAIDGDERLLVEAGTGTGKTLAYLVPALLSGRKVVVSTGTKTLQDQIATVDLPRLRTIFAAAGMGDQNLEWAVMKGLGNYVCRRRLDERERQQTLVADPDFERLLAFAASSPTGDRADLTDLADESPLWGEIAATPETRIGARCAFFESCFVTSMRRRAAAAPLVIVNHHLFFADLALRRAGPRRRCCPRTRWSSSTRPTRLKRWRRSSSASTPRRSGCSRSAAIWDARAASRPAAPPRPPRA